MWTNDIGRYGASNYALLRVIFEANLRLFNSHQKKKLLFVIRDFDFKNNSKENIVSSIDSDIKDLWGQIYKDDKYKETNPTDFFEFEYLCLPHKHYEEAKFNADCAILKARFNDQNGQ